MDHLSIHPGEVLTTYHLPAPGSWRASYVKLRRRGSFDFPVLGVAAWVKLDEGEVVVEARIVLGAVASWPMLVPQAGAALVGGRLTEDRIAAAAEAAWQVAKPMDNTDLTLSWRKEMVRVEVRRALSLTATRSPAHG
jgi:CO/xanthine dehydrogenase FAD-binding subunit